MDLLEALAKKSVDAIDGQYISEKIDKTIKAVYAYYSRSPQRLRGLMAMAKSLELPFHKLHYLFEVRFVESDFIAVTAFLVDYPVLVADLTRDQDKEDEHKVKMCVYLNRMKQFKFVAHLVVLIDAHESSKIFSKFAQSDADLCIDYPDHRGALKQRLEKAANGELGKAAKELLTWARITYDDRDPDGLE